MLVAVLIIPLGMVTSYADDDSSDDRKCKRPALQFGQSPIDITPDCLVQKRLPELRFSYRSGDVIDRVCFEVKDGELTPLSGSPFDSKEVVPEFVAKVKCNSGLLRICNDKYRLTSFHWHTPAEHHVDGVIPAMELHLVHEHVRTCAPLVVAVFYVAGAHNDAIDPIFSRFNDIVFPSAASPNNLACIPSTVENIPGIDDFDLNALLPPRGERTSFRYGGSFTTSNPATHVFEEGVRWIVMTEPVQASQEQIDSHEGIVGDAPGTGDLPDFNFVGKFPNFPDSGIIPPCCPQNVPNPFFCPVEFYERPFPPEGNAREIQDKADRKVLTDLGLWGGYDDDSDSDDGSGHKKKWKRKRHHGDDDSS